MKIKQDQESLDLAYMAGIFDGEGYVTIPEMKYKDRKGNNSPTHCLRIGIENTYKPMLFWINRILRGYFGDKNIGHANGKKINYKDMYKYILYGSEASLFLELILKHLKIKNKQAKLGIKFQNNLIRFNGRNVLPKKELNKRIRYKNKLEYLNKNNKGI